MTNGIVLSDLHLFSSRSNGFERLAAVYPEFRAAKVCVLNGDIFDFGWTILPSIEETVNRAEEWFREFLSSYSNCQFYYLYGNHDCHPLFAERLELIEKDFDNLKVEPYHVRLGKKLFLHGDTIHARDRSHTALDDYRENFAFDARQNGFMHGVFQLIIRLSFHRAYISLHNNSHYTQKILEYKNTHLKDEAIDTIYYGHVHSPYEERIDGVMVKNTGSMIAGLDYKIGRFDL